MRTLVQAFVTVFRCARRTLRFLVVMLNDSEGYLGVVLSTIHLRSFTIVQDDRLRESQIKALILSCRRRPVSIYQVRIDYQD